MQECQQEHHESTAERDSYCYKECLCGAADVVCPNVLRNKSGKGRHEAHGYQRKENKKFFRNADAGGSNNPQRVEDGCNDQKRYRYLKILRGNGQTQRNDSADSAFLDVYKRQIVSFDITDKSDSTTVKFFVKRSVFDNELKDKIKKDAYLRVQGEVQFDKYAKEINIMAKAIMTAQAPPPRMDTAEEKRVELHLHTQMSSMDGCLLYTSRCV